ncbi:MAG TPA: hypothetical protein VMF32_21735 [Xanthobacteraceae bacterium]|nr:hypothetical protein [Xanthobacteraceae bacterium]
MLARMKIVSRLMIGFGLLVIIITGLSGFSFYSATDTREALTQVVRLKNDETLTERALKQVGEARTAVWMALATNDQADWDHADDAFKAANTRLAEL